MRDLRIKKVLNGYRVNIGCQEVIFTSQKKMLKELARYLDNPDTVEQEYLKEYAESPVNPSDLVAEITKTDGPPAYIVYGDMR
jgi:hypothetical protein